MYEPYEDEEFRVVELFPYYFISNYGRLKRRERRGRKPLIRPNVYGDLVVTLHRGGSPTKYVCQIDRLVADAFLLPPKNPDKVHVHHIDGDKSNCHADNLEWR